MLLNYLKLATRLLLRNPFLTLINVLGLSVGLATFLLLWPLTEFELRSDRHHLDADRIIRLDVDYKWTDDNQTWNGFLGAFNWIAVNNEVARTFPQVETSAWIMPQSYFNQKKIGLDANIFFTIFSDAEKKSFREDNTVIGSPNLFTFFTIPLKEGDANTILEKPHSVVLSETLSRKYFGDDNSTGKTIYLNDTIPLLVTGVFFDLPHNTHLNFNMVFSNANDIDIDVKVFSNSFGACYLKLKEGETTQAFIDQLATQQQTLYDFTKLTCAHCDITAHPQSLTNVVFTNFRANTFTYKSKFLLEALAIVAFVVLGFAWINYITLSVNSLNKRLNEIGTRKCVGARTQDFFIQFFVESLVMNILSFGLAITLVQLIGKVAEEWFHFYIPGWDEINLKTTILILFTLGIGVLVATLSPLVLITQRKSTELFKKLKTSMKTDYTSTILVTTQYTVATVLLVWIGAVYFQLNFLLNKDIGVQKEELIVVNSPLYLNQMNENKILSFAKEVRRVPGVLHATASHSSVGDLESGGGIQIQLNGSSVWFGCDTNGGVDEAFLSTYGIKLLAGRNFQPDNPSDQTNVLVSKAMTMRLGIKSQEEAIGTKVLVFNDDSERKEAEIIGVISDYEFRPFFSNVTEPGRGVVLTYKNYLFREFKPLKLSLRFERQKLSSVLSAVEKLFNDTFGQPINWYFLDEKIRTQYADEQATKNQLLFFSLLAIGITCLGLFGMISNKALEKTKEIGIRKVLGARIDQIAQILLNTTSKQILTANIIGIPIAYFLVKEYLEKFSAHVDLHWWHYAIPVCILIIIMLTTITSILLKAARTNPTESLRYE